jgi:sigma-B regulation protein RsbU (phosphoserine phosphatase)
MLPLNTRQLATARYAGTSAAAGEIGGDYYDFLDLGHASLGFVLGDVSGKGIAAALLMANLQAAIRCECARGFHDLTAMLERVNGLFFASTLPAQYATLFFGRYDDRTRRLDYINCAQQPAIIVRREGRADRLETTAPPLGLFKSWAGQLRTVELGRGDTLCVCSDGVVEAGLDDGHEFGEDRLISLIAANPQPDIDLVVTRVANAARLFLTNGPSDDMTVIALRAV